MKVEKREEKGRTKSIKFYVPVGVFWKDKTDNLSTLSFAGTKSIVYRKCPWDRQMYIYYVYITVFVSAKSHGKKVWWLKAAATHDFFPDMTKAKFMRGEV